MKIELVASSEFGRSHSVFWGMYRGEMERSYQRPRQVQGPVCHHQRRQGHAQTGYPNLSKGGSLESHR